MVTTVRYNQDFQSEFNRSNFAFGNSLSDYFNNGNVQNVHLHGSPFETKVVTTAAENALYCASSKIYSVSCMTTSDDVSRSLFYISRESKALFQFYGQYDGNHNFDYMEGEIKILLNDLGVDRNFGDFSNYVQPMRQAASKLQIDFINVKINALTLAIASVPLVPSRWVSIVNDCIRKSSVIEADIANLAKSESECADKIDGYIINGKIVKFNQAMEDKINDNLTRISERVDAYIANKNSKDIALIAINEADTLSNLAGMLTQNGEFNKYEGGLGVIAKKMNAIAKDFSREILFDADAKALLDSVTNYKGLFDHQQSNLHYLANIFYQDVHAKSSLETASRDFFAFAGTMLTWENEIHAFILKHK